jgi:hypothetical protein
MLAINCVFTTLLRDATVKTLPLHDSQEGSGLAFTGCAVSKASVHGAFSRQGEHQYLQQVQFFTHWFQDLLPLFSICEFLKNTYISAGTDFWTYADWNFSAHLSD